MLEKFAGDLKSILRGNILILFITWILLNFGGRMVHNFDGIYFSALGASDVILGYMGAITFGMLALLQIPGGYFADTLGRKKIIVIFTFVMAFSMLIFALAPSWQYIVIGLIIENLALLYQPALFSMIMDSLPPAHRAEGFAITNLAILPSLIAPVIGGYLISLYGIVPGMRLGYLILFSLSLTSAILRIFLKETLKGRVPKSGFKESFKIIRQIDPRARGLILVAILSSAGSGASAYFIVKYAVTYTTSILFGIAIMLSLIIEIVVGIPMGRIADFHGKQKIFITGLVFTALSFFIFSFSGLIFLFLYSILGGLGFAMLSPSNSGLMADFVEDRNRGRFTGVYLFSSYISAMLFSVLAGYIYAINNQLLFIIASSLIFIASLTAYVFILHPSVRHKNGDFSRKY